MADYSTYHGKKDCSLVFDSVKSLDVNIQYEKENILSKWTQQPSGNDSKNIHVKKKNQMTSVLTDSIDLTNAMSSDRYYKHYIPVTSVPTPNREISAYVPKEGSGVFQLAGTPTPNLCSSSSSDHQTVPTSNSCRFDPYRHYSVAESSNSHRNGNISSSSPRKCEKCGFFCVSESELMDHICPPLLPTPIPDLLDVGDINIKIDSKASQVGTLNLASHKGQVQQPPPMSQEHPISPLMPLVNNVPERFHPQNSRGLSSPDYWRNGSTTIVTPANHSDQLSHQQPTTYQYSHIRQLLIHQYASVAGNSQQQISSTHIPMVVNYQTQNKMLKSDINSRRPKTYNCSTCNKWFTSSGHLKRHYKAMLHKNAVKQSGALDPATMPISSYKHLQKDPNYMSPHSPNKHQQDPSLSPSPPSEMQQQQEPFQLLNHHFLPDPPNLMVDQDQLPLPSCSQFQNNDFTTIFSSLQPVVNPTNYNVGGLSLDQTLHNFDSKYLSQSSSDDSYSLENITPSIDETFFK